MTSLATVDVRGDMIHIPNQTNPIAAMLNAVTEHGVTAESAAAMKELTALYLQMEAVNAAKAFAAAKAELQAELPSVAATRVIPNNDGGVRSVFAAYEDILVVVQPFLTKHGFSVSFTMKSETSASGKDRICAVCKLTHRGGHSETNEFSVRVSAPPKASDAQADGATRSYARRGALCDALNVAIDRDDDARMEGDYITQHQADTLRKRQAEVGGDAKKFLSIAGVERFEDVRTGKLGVLYNLLAQKEEQKKSKAPADGKPSPEEEAAIRAEEVAMSQPGR